MHRYVFGRQSTGVGIRQDRRDEHLTFRHPASGDNADIWGVSPCQHSLALGTKQCRDMRMIVRIERHLHQRERSRAMKQNMARRFETIVKISDSKLAT